MTKATAQDDSEIRTPEQVVADTSFADIYFLGIPRVTMEAINGEAKKRGQTFAQALAEAVDDWLKKEGP